MTKYLRRSGAPQTQRPGGWQTTTRRAPRRFSVIGLALAGLLLLSGCGGEPGRGGDTVPGGDVPANAPAEVPGVAPGEEPPGVNPQPEPPEPSPAPEAPELPGVEPEPTPVPDAGEDLRSAVQMERDELLARATPEPETADRVTRLSTLPSGLCDALAALASYDWVSAEARAFYDSARLSADAC